MKLNLEKSVEWLLMDRYNGYRNKKLDDWYEEKGWSMTSIDVRKNILSFEDWLKDRGLTE